jgi:hypothetical protein
MVKLSPTKTVWSGFELKYTTVEERQLPYKSHGSCTRDAAVCCSGWLAAISNSTAKSEISIATACLLVFKQVNRATEYLTHQLF